MNGNKLEMSILSERLNKFKNKIILSILGLTKTEFQKRLAATIIENVFRFSPLARVLLGLVLHIWTVLFAYAKNGFVGAVLTAILPIASQIYWLIVLFFESSPLFLAFLFALVSYVVFICLSKMLTPVRFSFSYKWK